MASSWLVTPFYFEHPEPALFSAAPDGAAKNAPTGIDDRSPESMARLHRPIAHFVDHALSTTMRPISLAGDCCTAIPVLAGLRAAGIDPTVSGLMTMAISTHLKPALRNSWAACLWR
jgi:hypothetical protein